LSDDESLFGLDSFREDYRAERKYIRKSFIMEKLRLRF